VMGDAEAMPAPKWLPNTHNVRASAFMRWG
jgi:hypothetical protein